MSCDWRQPQHYTPLRERIKVGAEFSVRGEPVTVYEYDTETETVIVRPHSNPVNLVVVEVDELE